MTAHSVLTLINFLCVPILEKIKLKNAGKYTSITGSLLDLHPTYWFFAGFTSAPLPPRHF